MARRKADPAGSALLIVALLLFILIKLLIGIAVSACAYLGLPWLVIGVVEAIHGRSACRARCAWLLEAAKSFDWRDQRQAIQYLERARRDAQGKIDRIYELGDSKGWRRTGASDGRRFDRRNAQAERFNQELDELEAETSWRESSIEDQKQSASQSIPDWRTAHDELVRLEASSAVLGVAASVYAGVFLFFIVLQPQWISYLSDAAIWAIAPLQQAYGPAALATVAYWSVGAWLRGRKRRELHATLHVDLVAAWNGIETDIRTADRIAASPDDSTAHTESESRRRKSSSDSASSRTTAPDSNRAWFSVLEVSENASAEEIRRAWKQRVSEYHPDKVASRGQRLRDLAAAETMAINEAYQTARQLGRA